MLFATSKRPKFNDADLTKNNIFNENQYIFKNIQRKTDFLPQMCPAKYLKSVKSQCFLEVKIRVFP